ncbi:MAG TPA: YraN family protein [Phycisphaerae bacterium]|nr:YraN family protein [Phycisphaerae bacterium]
MAAIFDFLRRRPSKRTDRQKTGDAGERVAERFLKRHGYRIVARNVACRRGEVDLVAVEKRTGTLCFVEVRSRVLGDGDKAVVEPEETVTLAKRRRIVAAARTYLARRRTAGRGVRFDVIAVRFAVAGDKRPDIRHYAGAFDAAGRTM